MAIRFKFRSSVNFDMVAIGDQPSIPVRDLKSRILRQKNLNLCQGFDLVFSDALTGQEYADEDFQIPNGSCVIIRRVPSVATHTDIAQYDSFKDYQSQPTTIVKSSPAVDIDSNELDDFGIDLYSVPQPTTSPCDLDGDLRIQGDEMHFDTERFSKPFKGDWHRVHVSDLNEAIAGGPPPAGTKGNTPEMKTIPKTEDCAELKRVTKDITPSLQLTDSPPELKCSICDSFFKDAIMIPCCQHSFCEKCISLVLVEKGRCPKCYSTTCTAEDLLPNVSLRRVIEHFCESQTLMTSRHITIHQYPPDGESEVHAKDVPYNVAYQKETNLPHSPSPTETGSNEIMGESACDLLFRENASPGGIGSHFAPLGAKSCDKRKIIKERHASTHLEEMGGFNGNLGKWQHTNEEVKSIIKEKKQSGVNAATAGGEKRLMDARRRRKGNITCYKCGSPNHVIRECPATSSPNPMPQRGIAMLPQSMPISASPYWNVATFNNVGPFTNLYGNHGVVPFNLAVFPSGPCAFPTYMPSMYGGVPSIGGLMKTGGVAYPMGANRAHQVSGLEFLDLQNHKCQKLSSESMRRENAFDNDDDCNKQHLYGQTESSQLHKSYLMRDKSVSSSYGRHPQWEKKKDRCHNLVDNEFLSYDAKTSHSLNGRVGRSYRHPEQSSSEVEDFPYSSCCCSEERTKHHHRNFKRERERERDDSGVETNSRI